MIRKLFCITLLLFAGSAWSADKLLVVTDLSDEHLAYRPDLRMVASQALAQLAKYDVADATTSVRPNSEARIDAMIDAAERADLDAVAVVTLYNPSGRRATLTMSLYKVPDGDLIIERALEFRFRDIQALLAQLEYELPLMLKREFRELGSVIRVNDNQVYFDLGANAGIETGQLFRVFRRGDEINDARGESYGYLDEQSGVIEVISVNAVYSVAKIKLGRLSIRHNDWVERAEPGLRADGRILAKLDNEVAINLGQRAGVVPGSYFAVFKHIKPIDEEQSFREVIGRIRIQSVDGPVARGEIARSDHYDLAKALIEEGDTVEEVGYRHRNQLVIGRSSFGILDQADSTYFVGFHADVSRDIRLGYRLRASVSSPWYGSVGLVSALNHSESFRYGLDAIYGTDGLGTQLFVAVDVPTPLDDRVRFSLESGYLLGAIDRAEGVSISLSARLGLGSL